MRQYETFELTLHGEAPAGSQAAIDLEAVFTGAEECVTVKGFYAGNSEYRIRFYPRYAGEYSYEVKGLFTERGTLHCEPAQEGHRGMVRTCGYHFRYENGERYCPFGTTIYGMVNQEEALVNTTMDTLSKAPFNKVRFCVFPKYYDFNHNEPPLYAFEKTDGKWDVNRPCFAYWDMLERRILELQELGIEADLILFHPYDRWGFAKFTMEESLTYLDYLLRRLSAIPNLWWSMSNEYDLILNYEKQDWITFAKFITANDPYAHLLSNHNCCDFWDFTQPEITHCSIQEANVGEIPERQETYGKPVIIDECCYEGNIIHQWGNLSGREMTSRFWTAVCCGGYCTHGETFYDENEVLWWAKGGILKGESPERIRFLRELVESFPGSLTFYGNDNGAYTLGQMMEWKRQGTLKREEDFFRYAMLQMPENRLEAFLQKERLACGHYEDQVYLQYYGRQCTAKGILYLPENGSYRVEVIDTWEMTRTTVEEAAHGTLEVALPGKEGMAILATKL